MTYFRVNVLLNPLKMSDNPVGQLLSAQALSSDNSPLRGHLTNVKNVLRQINAQYVSFQHETLLSSGLLLIKSLWLPATRLQSR